MQSPPFGILGINNNNPCHASNPLQRQQTQEQDKPDNSLLSWSWTLPLGLANAEEKEEKEAQKQRLQERQEKSTLLGRRSSCSSWHWWHSSGTSHSWCWWQWCFCRLFSSSVRQSRSGNEEGTAVAAPVAKKRHAGNPYHPGCCSTLLFSTLRHNYPKDLPQGTTLLIKSGYRSCKKKETGEGFKTYDLVGINGGLWYVCPSSPSGRNR